MQVKLEMSTNGTSTSPMAMSKGSDDTRSDTTIATMREWHCRRCLERERERERETMQRGRERVSDSKKGLGFLFIYLFNNVGCVVYG